jgi:phage shock protein A
MSFFSRVNNLIRGFLSLFISGIERENPEIAYENARNGMIEKYNKAKNAVAAIIANRLKVEERLKRNQAALSQVNADLEAALDTNQDDLAELLVQKQEELTRQVNEGTVELERLSKQAEDAKGMLITFQGEIKKLEAERDEMLAKNAVAKAQIAVQDQLSGLSVDAEIRALDNVREGINNTVAKAQLNTEIAGTDVDTRLAKLRQTAGSASAKSKVAALKAARQADAAKTL